MRSMHDVWASDAYGARDSKPVRGARLYSSLGVYFLTKRTRAAGMSDGLHTGCVMAVLSVLNSFGEGLVIHTSKHPASRWVANPKRPVPPPSLTHRVLYKVEVHPRIEGHSIVMVQSNGGYYDGQPSALLIRGKVPKACTL